MNHLRRGLIMLLLCCFVPTLRAADTNGDGIETVLVPFGMLSNIEFPGAFGTVWRGALYVANVGTEEIWLQARYGCTTECNHPVSPGFSGIIGGDGSTRSLASLLYLRADDGPRTVISSRLYELSRANQPEGVEMPVVREGQFLKGIAGYLGVPGGPRARAALRIYDPYRVGVQVHVEILSPGNVATPVASTDLTTTIDPDDGLSSKLSPGFAAIYDLGAVFPIINSLSTYDVRVSPLQPDREYFAMVSVTDNETQHVLVITSR